MSTNKIYTIVSNKIQMPCIGFMNIYFAVCTFVFKVYFFFTTCNGDTIKINTNYITVEQFCFYKSRPSTCKLIKN